MGKYSLTTRQLAAVSLKPSLWRAWWKSWHTVPVHSWLIGANCFRNKDYKRAVYYYSIGLERHDAHKAKACALFDRANAYYRLGEIENARQDLLQLVNEANVPKSAYLLLARIERLYGRPMSAASLLTKCLMVFPEDVQTEVCLLDSLLDLSEPTEEIIEVYQSLQNTLSQISLSTPFRPIISTALARYELLFGDAKHGEQVLARGLAGGEYPLEALVLRAQCLLVRNRIQQARFALERAVQMVPTHPEAYALLARSYFVDSDLNSFKWAVQLATKACQLSGWLNPNYLQALADAYEHTGEPLLALMMTERIANLADCEQLSSSAQTYLSDQIERLLDIAKLPLQSESPFTQ